MIQSRISLGDDLRKRYEGFPFIFEKFPRSHLSIPVRCPGLFETDCTYVLGTTVSSACIYRVHRPVPVVLHILTNQLPSRTISVKVRLATYLRRCISSLSLAICGLHHRALYRQRINNTYAYALHLPSACILFLSGRRSGYISGPYQHGNLCKAEKAERGVEEWRRPFREGGNGEWTRFRDPATRRETINLG